MPMPSDTRAPTQTKVEQESERARAREGSTVHDIEMACKWRTLPRLQDEHALAQRLATLERMGYARRFSSSSSDEDEHNIDASMCGD